MHSQFRPFVFDLKTRLTQLIYFLMFLFHFRDFVGGGGGEGWRGFEFKLKKKNWGIYLH